MTESAARRSELETLQHLDPASDALTLSLIVEDPEVLAALRAHPEGRVRHDFALSAIRIGILALKQAQGRIDADIVHNEGERLLEDMARSLEHYQQGVANQIATTLKEYFDPTGGRFSERVDRLLRKDGELEHALLRQIGTDDSELAKTLANHIGSGSPLMKLLDPGQSNGLVQSVQKSLESALKSERDRIMGEFSLDNKDGALTRLVDELSTRHGKLTSDLQGSVKEVVGEFSLDNDKSALSRLVKRVEQAQKQISSEFSLDTDASALARMKRELTKVFDSMAKQNADFQTEIRQTLAALHARKQEAKRSTRHGNDFEAALHEAIVNSRQTVDDIVESVGSSAGRIKHCKVGDLVITLGPDNIAAGAMIVIEAKEDASYDQAKALKEIQRGRENRGAEVGIFVFSNQSAPKDQQPLLRYGNDILVVWDAEAPETDVFLDAAISLSRALCSRVSREKELGDVDFGPMDKAIREIERQAQTLDDIVKWSGTIQTNSTKILDKAGSIRHALGKQIEALDHSVTVLRHASGQN
jgi:gas vesicle protein